MTAGGGEAFAWLEDLNQRRIPVRGSCSIGRSASNQLPLESDRVSRHHALIQQQGDQAYWLIDLGSSNGTYLNGQRASNPRRLQDGDRISMGPFEFRFRLAGANRGDLSNTKLSERTLADIRHAKCWLLVADIIASTRLFKELTPDEVPVVAGCWLEKCRRTIEEQGGSINQFMGDGFFAYWREREKVEIAITEALKALGKLQDLAQPDFRMALHFGEVILGGVSLGEEERISGEAVHFTFRMEKRAAELGEARLLSQMAFERLSTLLETRNIGEHALPGFETKVRLYAF